MIKFISITVLIAIISFIMMMVFVDYPNTPRPLMWYIISLCITTCAVWLIRGGSIRIVIN